MSEKRILYLDCTSGISGDMSVAALLDLGIDEEKFRQELRKLDFGGYELAIGKLTHNCIEMMDFDVILDSNKHGHSHDHSENHNHHSHSEDHEHRNLKMILDIIDRSTITDNAKAIGRDIFTEIAKAEAQVHGKTIEDVHFHEVGAVDSLVDIMGFAICLDMLGIDEVYASPLHEGSGTIMCQHGILPVPVPAVSAILSGSGIPVVQEDVGTELITPTGAGIAKCMVKSFGKMPPMKIEKVGYGHGKRDTGLFGAVRAFMGVPFEE